MMGGKDELMEGERRAYSRFETSIPIHFNLNPDYHYVPTVRKLGVGGTARDISPEGLRVGVRMDQLDLFQIFPEEMEDDSPFELEVFLLDLKERRELIKGAVRWYRLSEPENDIWHFEAGLYLKDDASRALARGIIASMDDRSETGGDDDSKKQRKTPLSTPSR
jgi:hypothetical protein